MPVNNRIYHINCGQFFIIVANMPKKPPVSDQCHSTSSFPICICRFASLIAIVNGLATFIVFDEFLFAKLVSSKEKTHADATTR